MSFSIMTLLFYITTKDVLAFPFLPMPKLVIFHFLGSSHSHRCKVTFLHFPNGEQFSIYLLTLSSFEKSLFISLLILVFFPCWGLNPEPVTC